METYVPPAQKALREALSLSEELLRNIELSELPLANLALKASRLARLLNEFDVQKIMEYEASGYPTTPSGVQPEIYKLAVLAEREYEIKDAKSGQTNKRIFLESIEELELQTRIAEVALDSAKDPDISVASANPRQTVISPSGNWFERQSIRQAVTLASRRLSGRRSYIYSYVLRKQCELEFSGIADDIFSRIRGRVDSAIGSLVPDAAQKLVAVYENLQSENPEDWSNAVHSCRRILQDMADALYPPRQDKTSRINGKETTIHLGKDHYINRLIAFLGDKSESSRFKDVAGSSLKFIGDRLDSVFLATQKGSHDMIVSKEEADRYVVYTYLVVGDILSLADFDGSGPL